MGAIQKGRYGTLERVMRHVSEALPELLQPGGVERTDGLAQVPDQQVDRQVSGKVVMQVGTYAGRQAGR